MTNRPNLPKAVKTDGTIPEPAIDVDAIMATIRGTQSGGAEVALPLTAPDDEQPLLDFLLRELTQTSSLTRPISPEITPSRLDNLPVIGGLWRSLRRQLHGLSVFYANKATRQTIVHQQYLATTLNLITRQAQQREAKLEKLSQRLDRLEARLARGEDKL